MNLPLSTAFTESHRYKYMEAKQHASAAAKLLQSCPTLCDPIDGNPLQYSCLENPRDEGAWWAAAVYGVAQSQTRLKRLSSSSSSSTPKVTRKGRNEEPQG